MLLAINFVLCVFLYVFYQHKQQIKSDQELWCVRRIVYLYVDFCPLIVVYESNCIIIWRDFFLWSLVSIHSITIIFLENVLIKCYIRKPCWSIFDIESYSIRISYLTDSCSVLFSSFVKNNKSWCLRQKPPTCQ